MLVIKVNKQNIATNITSQRATRSSYVTVSNSARDMKVRIPFKKSAN